MKIGNITQRKQMQGKLFEVEMEDEELNLNQDMATAAIKFEENSNVTNESLSNLTNFIRIIIGILIISDLLIY